MIPTSVSVAALAATSHSTAPGSVTKVDAIARAAQCLLPIFQPTTLPLWDLKYWENVTKLNGAALLAYLIISEGSRLFPP